MEFILASKSPRRKELLEKLNINFTVCESNVDESVLSHDLSPQLYVQELAMLKSSDVADKSGRGKLVIGADTIVVYNNRILGKPRDFDDAFSMLKSFSGNTHVVYTGISVTDSSDMRTVTTFCESRVTFFEITDEEISNYINTYKPYDKAGAYGIQEYASVFVKKIDGDFFNIVGLPISSLYRLLKNEFNVII